MITSFKHKGLKDLFFEGKTKRINVEWHERIFILLDRLHAAIVPEDMNLPGFRFHTHGGTKKKDPKRYSVDVTGNYRILFEWEDDNATRVDLKDPH